MEPTVGSLIQAELERRAWLQADLARVLGWPVQTMSEVMQGKRRIDAGMALDLAAVTSMQARDWLGVQAALDLDSAQRSPGLASRLDQIGMRADLEDIVPVRELVRRGAISSADPASQRQEVESLLEVRNITDDPPYLVSAKRTQDGVPLTRAQKAWVALARQRARRIATAAFDEESFRLLAQSLPRELSDPGDFEELPDRFATCGVRLVHIPAFPGGRIDGVSLELDSTPMIALSGRGKRIDRVLFALLHECAHVLLGHWRAGLVRVHDGNSVGDPETEDAVNLLAKSWIFPEGLATSGFAGNAAGIEVLARRTGVSRAVIIGQLQHMGVIPWSASVSRGLPTVEESLLAWD